MVADTESERKGLQRNRPDKGPATETNKEQQGRWEGNRAQTDTCLCFPNCLSLWNPALLICSFPVPRETPSHFTAPPPHPAPATPSTCQIPTRPASLSINASSSVKLFPAPWIPEPHLPPPPKKFEAPSLCNTYLISIVIVGTFPSQLLWAPRGLGPCLFTFVTVHLALDQYVLNEEMRSVEPDQ